VVGHQFEITPKAFANFSPGLERSDNPGTKQRNVLTLKGFLSRRTLTGLNRSFSSDPKVLAALEPWAEISERLRRNFKLTHYRTEFFRIDMIDCDILWAL